MDELQASSWRLPGYGILVLAGDRCALELGKNNSWGWEGGYPKDFHAFWFQYTINENMKAQSRSNDRLIAPPWKCLQMVFFMVLNVRWEAGVKWYIHLLGNAKKRPPSGLVPQSMASPWERRSERETGLSHLSLVLDIFVTRQLTGSLPDGDGGWLDTSLPAWPQEAALSSKIMFLVETFIRTITPLSLVIWELNISPLCLTSVL